MQSGTFHVITFGCQMNVHDSEWLNQALPAIGLDCAPLEKAQVIIINTCSVRKKPEEKVRSVLGRIKALTNNDRNVYVVVCGCVAQQQGKNLFGWSSQVRLVAGTDEISNLPGYIAQILNFPDRRIARLNFLDTFRERHNYAENNISGMVSIMQGCDNFCSYCIVPYTRGRQKSRLKKNIVEECKNAVLNGARELTLLGQNVNAWGKDNGQSSFADLVREIASLPNLMRLKYITSHPKDMNDEDIKVFGEFPNLAAHLHLPLQSGSDRILALMRRRYSFHDYRELLAKLRSARASMTFTTDIIVGFPGESDRDFALTLDALHECGFINSFSFCYSDRPGTRASLFPDKIPVAVQRERLACFQNAQQILAESWLKSRVGAETEILLETRSPIQEKGGNSWQGRDEHGIIVHVDMPKDMDCKSKVVKCRIAEARRHSLIGYII